MNTPTRHPAPRAVVPARDPGTNSAFDPFRASTPRPIERVIDLSDRQEELSVPRRSRFAVFVTALFVLGTIALGLPTAGAGTLAFSGSLAGNGTVEHSFSSSPGIITATLSCKAPSKVSMSILNISRISLISQTVVCKIGGTASVTASLTGTYWVRLTEKSGVGTTYDLTVSVPNPVTSTSAPTTTTTALPTTTTTVPTGSQSYPTAPPVQVCGNTSLLGGPATQPPGSVRIDPGVTNLNDATMANPAGTTFWLAPGTHRLSNDQYAQVIPKSGNVYIGAPGAILDGAKLNRYAFTQQATNVRVAYLTIQNFMAPGDEGVVNHDFGAGWTIDHNTVQFNGGAGVMLGDDNTMSYNCLADNSQYGFQGFGARLTVDHNEVARNNTFNYEQNIPGCGCSGGAKFWSAGPATITDNYVHDNYNVGLWADNNNVGFLIQHNYISDNRSHGIMYETSYNVRIINNTFLRNAIPVGQDFQSRNDPFPVGAIYISESGGDSRVAGGLYAASEVSGNMFDNNWGGVAMWENADRFGNDGSANTSKGYTTLVVDPTGVKPSPYMYLCGDPATGGLINVAPYYSDCRWKTQNVAVTNNDFRMDKTVIGCTTTYCGNQALFSNVGTYPTWSPYQGRVVQDAITYSQNNHFSGNRYVGDWHFTAYEPGRILTSSVWQAAPYNQDAGSTFSTGTGGSTTTTTSVPATTTTTLPPTTTTVPATTTTTVPATTTTTSPSTATQLLNAEQMGIEGPGGVLWTGLVNATVARSTAQAHGGTSSLAITATAAGQMDVVLTAPWPATSAGLTDKASVWIRQVNAGHYPTLYLRFASSTNNFLGDVTASPAESTTGWYQGTVTGVAPPGTASARIQVTWFGMSAGEIVYLDDASLTAG